MIEGLPAHQKIENCVQKAEQDLEDWVYFCDVKLLTGESHNVLMGVSS